MPNNTIDRLEHAVARQLLCFYNVVLGKLDDRDFRIHA
jgi:hypothetical protein